MRAVLLGFSSCLPVLVLGSQGLRFSHAGGFSQISKFFVIHVCGLWCKCDRVWMRIICFSCTLTFNERLYNLKKNKKKNKLNYHITFM